MHSKEYIRAAIGELEYTDNENGTTVTLVNAFETREVDFSNRDNVLAMVAYAIETADGIHKLVSEKCDTNRIISEYCCYTELLIALSALACEIYMKALIYYNEKSGGKKLIEHRLDELFDMLDESVQTRIKDKLGITTQYLKEVGQTFIELRYVFELNYIDKNYLIVFDLMDELKTICSEVPMDRKLILRATSATVRIIQSLSIFSGEFVLEESCHH